MPRDALCKILGMVRGAIRLWLSMIKCHGIIPPVRGHSLRRHWSTHLRPYCYEKDMKLAWGFSIFSLLLPHFSLSSGFDSSLPKLFHIVLLHVHCTASGSASGDCPPPLAAVPPKNPLRACRAPKQLTTYFESMHTFCPVGKPHHNWQIHRLPPGTLSHDAVVGLYGLLLSSSCFKLVPQESHLHVCGAKLNGLVPFNISISLLFVLH